MVAAGLVHQLRAVFHPFDASRRSAVLISRAASAERCARLRTSGGHDRETPALLAGARGFHRGVQRQDVGLEGDAVDHADDVVDLAWSCR